jgi:hypothetical protein
LWRWKDAPPGAVSVSGRKDSCGSIYGVVVLYQDALADDPKALEAERLAQIDGPSVQRLVRWPRPLPLQEERARLLREVNTWAPWKCLSRNLPKDVKTQFEQHRGRGTRSAALGCNETLTSGSRNRVSESNAGKQHFDDRKLMRKGGLAFGIVE